MKSEKNSSGQIPSRKNVHFRTPPGSSDKTPTNSHNVNKSTSPSQGTPKKNTGNSTQNTSKHNVKSTSVPPKVSSGNTNENILHEKTKNLEKILKEEIQKTENLRKDIKKRNIENFKAETSSILKGILIGVIIALAFGILIIFTHYRSLSSFSRDTSEYTLKCYEYLDLSSTDEKIIEKITNRKEGKEKPEISLDKEIKVIDSDAYIPYSSIADYFNFSIAGDTNSRTVIVGGARTDYSGENTAVFTFDSNEILVNGAVQHLSSVSFMINDELYIPWEFIETFVKGISLTKSTDKGLTNISVIKQEPDVRFGGSSNSPVPTPDIQEFIDKSVPFYEYSVDLSKYNQYINPPNSDKYLILVNIDNKLSEEYIPEELTSVKTNPSRPTQKLCVDAAMSLTAFLTAAEAAGYGDISVTSGYRSYSHQASLFNQKLEINKKKYDSATAEMITAESVMYPGASEHQTGLCVDMHNMSTEMTSFSGTPEYKWLIEHCSDFGFILRYPQTRENITGVKFEPWHFRFVGRTHAQKIMSSGISLEEYIESYNATEE